MPYLHGAYGEIAESSVADATQSGVVAAYIGTAPVNLIRGYADKGIVNMPVKVANMSDVEKKLGYSDDWERYTLCEAFAEHFDNTVGNVGPIFVVNVLDPDTHRATEQTTQELTFTNKRAEFEDADIILDTFAIADKVEGTDYTLSYNYLKHSVIVTLLTEAGASLQATYYKVDTSKIEAANIIGQATAEGEYTGLHAFSLLYQYHNAVLDILAAPGWSDKPAVYAAMVSTVQKLNGHWDGFVNADIPIADNATIEKAIEWKEDNGYTSELSKVYWPKVTDGSGRVFHLSTVATATMLRVDTSHRNIPFESPSNKEIMAVQQYFGTESKNKGFDQQTANSLNEKGITTAVFWAGQWVLWGPHTAAYSYGGNMDARAIFDVNIRMLMYITNNFQIEHGTKIDAPLSPNDRDTILNREREKLDVLHGMGAIIGTPTVAFLETENPVSDMVNGDFVWDIAATNTPPMKSAKVRVRYTDEGFAAFFSE